MKSELEATLGLHMRGLHLEPESEYRFHDTRRWRFDFAFPYYKIGIECEGGNWSGGRHVTGSGFEKDCEKYNAAGELGWTVLRYTKKMITSGEAVAQIERMIRG